MLAERALNSSEDAHDGLWGGDREETDVATLSMQERDRSRSRSRPRRERSRTPPREVRCVNSATLSVQQTFTPACPDSGMQMADRPVGLMRCCMPFPAHAGVALPHAAGPATVIAAAPGPQAMTGTAGGHALLAGQARVPGAFLCTWAT